MDDLYVMGKNLFPGLDYASNESIVITATLPFEARVIKFKCIYFRPLSLAQVSAECRLLEPTHYTNKAPLLSTAYYRMKMFQSY